MTQNKKTFSEMGDFDTPGDWYEVDPGEGEDTIKGPWPEDRDGDDDRNEDPGPPPDQPRGPGDSEDPPPFDPYPELPPVPPPDDRTWEFPLPPVPGMAG